MTKEAGRRPGGVLEGGEKGRAGPSSGSGPVSWRFGWVENREGKNNRNQLFRQQLHSNTWMKSDDVEEGRSTMVVRGHVLRKRRAPGGRTFVHPYLRLYLKQTHIKDTKAAQCEGSFGFRGD